MQNKFICDFAAWALKERGLMNIIFVIVVNYPQVEGFQRLQVYDFISQKLIQGAKT